MKNFREDIRNYGVDFYRIVLTFMICLLHTLYLSGMLSSYEQGSFLYKINWLLETISYCAVDGYALISGYIAEKKVRNYERIITMWFQVFFYSFLLSIILFFLGLEGDMSRTTIIKSMIPVTSGTYWYFSAYFALSLLEPFIIKGLTQLNESDLKKIIILIIGIFSVSGFLLDGYAIGSGYSFCWLSLLYVLGYAIRKVKLLDKWSKKKLFLNGILMVLISWLFYILKGKKLFISYVSPTIVFEAIFFLILFSKLNLNEKAIKVIKMLSSLTLGIYLFQCNRIVWNNLSFVLVSVKNFETLLIIPVVLLSALIIFISGGIVDFLRIKIFSLIKIKELSKYLNVKVLEMFSFIERLM